MSAAQIIEAVGNVVSSVEIDEVLFTLATDAIVRVNDLGTGINVARTSYPSLELAQAAYVALVAKAQAMAA